MTTDTKKWSDHKIANPDIRFITKQTADSRDYVCVSGQSAPTDLHFYITIGGDEMVAVKLWVAAKSQRRAEQYALAWTRTRWARDKRTLCVTRTEIVD
jgi:hypothetical protein